MRIPQFQNRLACLMANFSAKDFYQQSSNRLAHLRYATWMLREDLQQVAWWNQRVGRGATPT